MKIRNDKIINKLKKTNNTHAQTEHSNNSVVITEEEWRSELGVSESNNEIIKRIVNKSIALVGCCFLINFFSLYFFDVALDITDFDLMFFLFSVLAIYTAGNVVLHLQIKKVFESNLSLDDRMEALVTRKLFTGWQLKLIWVSIVLSILGFMFNFISLAYNEFDIDSNNFDDAILCFVLASSLISLIKIGEALILVGFFFLSCFCYSTTNWLIDEYGINEEHTTFYSFVAEELLGIETAEPAYDPDYQPERVETQSDDHIDDNTSRANHIPVPERFEDFKK